MSLPGRVKKIAKGATYGLTKTIGDLNNLNATSSTNVTSMASVVSFQGSGQYLVTMDDGSQQTITYQGTRPIGPGDNLLVSNGIGLG